MNFQQQQRLAALVANPVKWQCSLSPYTSFAIGGPADALVGVESQRELQAVLHFLAEENIPWRIIGKGTNLLVRDAGFPGVILRLGGDLATVVEADDGGQVALCVGGGASLAKIAMGCSEKGLGGLEFACGIPGTIGGAVIMNAGAWGRDIAQVLQSVTLVSGDGEVTLAVEDLRFSYRCCRGFAPYQGKAVVAAVRLLVQRGKREEIMATCKEFLQRRKAAQPSDHASAGSFFKNPANDSAGRLIEASGLKGAAIGGAKVSEHHANFLVNTGGASAADVMQLMKIIQDKVKRDSGVSLEPEVHFI